MDNLITINYADPIREEYNKAIDKVAAINTIAFKYFRGDRLVAHKYLDNVDKDLPNSSEINKSKNQCHQLELI